MTLNPFHARAAAAALLVVSGLLVSGYAGGAALRHEETDARRTAGDPAPADIEAVFPDAPHGVDPVVTGPVSAEFKLRREALGCDAATWPDIPADCYPD